MESNQGNAQSSGAFHFHFKRLIGFFPQRLIRRCDIDQVAGMDRHRSLCHLYSGGFSFICRDVLLSERFRSPLPVALCKNEHRFTANIVSALESFENASSRTYVCAQSHRVSF